MRKFKYVLLVAFSVLFLAACSKVSPILNPVSSVPANLTVKQIETAILAAQDSDRGWTLKKQSDGTIKGYLVNRSFTAEVIITYSAKQYAIRYESSSTNLLKKGDMIHRNYNRWIGNLDRDIKRELNKAGR